MASAPPLTASQQVVAARIGELSGELTATVLEAEAQVKRNRDALAAEFEATRLALHTEYRLRTEALDKELQAMEEQQALMKQIDVKLNDVVTINCGGDIFSMKRGTLCLFEESFLSGLFSGRWESSMIRDPKGNYFLDFDPALFSLILNYLRDKKIETPDRPATVPSAPNGKHLQFDFLLDYLGLKPYMYPSSSPGSPARGGSEGGSLLESSAPLSASFGLGLFGRPGAGSTQPAGNSTSASSSSSAAPASLSQSQEGVVEEPAPVKKVGWSKRVASHLVRVDNEDPQLVSIPDTRAKGHSAALRATRGYQVGQHYWEINVLMVSDWSYVGFVSGEWDAFSQILGKGTGSWGIASNGVAHAEGAEVAKLPTQYTSGSVIGFLIDLDSPGRTCTLIIDGQRYEDVFFHLPAAVFPAVGNCRSAAKYSLTVDIDAPVVPPSGIISTMAAAT